MNETLQIGLYEHSLAEAERTNELELWLYSKIENKRCKEALEQLVTEQPEAASLDSEQGQNLLREFGAYQGCQSCRWAGVEYETDQFLRCCG